MAADKEAGADITDAARTTATTDAKQEEEEEEEGKGYDQSANENVTVAVTGASGFIAAHCIKLLLDKGYNVRGTVRGDPSSERYRWITDIPSKFNIANKSVQLYQADLLQNDSFIECFTDCDYILHVASPFSINPQDPLKDLVEPARNGTINVLNCALAASSQSDHKKLQRIVVTSSIAAITGDADPSKIYTEKDWNDASSLNSQPYSYSKTEAERAAWNWMDENKTKIGFDLVTVNPGLVLGRHLNDGLKQLNESNDVLCKIINGAFPARINIAFTIVDVRDVAAAHIFLIEDKGKQIGQGRHLCVNEYMRLTQVMDFCDVYCATRGINRSIPCCRCDCACCWCCIMCIACCQTPGEADYLRNNVNKNARFDGSKLKQMGFVYRDKNSTLIDTLDYLLEAGFIAK